MALRHSIAPLPITLDPALIGALSRSVYVHVNPARARLRLSLDVYVNLAPSLPLTFTSTRARLAPVDADTVGQARSRPPTPQDSVRSPAAFVYY